MNTRWADRTCDTPDRAGRSRRGYDQNAVVSSERSVRQAVSSSLSTGDRRPQPGKSCRSQPDRAATSPVTTTTYFLTERLRWTRRRAPARRCCVSSRAVDVSMQSTCSQSWGRADCPSLLTLLLRLASSFCKSSTVMSDNAASIYFALIKTD